MSGNVTLTLAGMGGYFFFFIIAGVWFAKHKDNSPEQFFLGDRSLSPLVAAMSAEASDMSGWLLMGLPGVAYFTGVGEAFWTAVGLFLGTWINWLIVAKRLRVYSQVAGNSFTLPLFFSNRFHDTKRILLTIAAVIIVLFFSIYVAAQFVTFGKLFEYIFGRSDYYVYMVLIGAALVLAYTLLGGFLAESFADTVQGMLMVAALLLMLVFGITHSGGIGGVAERLADFPRFCDIFGIATPTVQDGVQAVQNGIPQFGPGANYSLLNIVSCMAWGLGYFGMPQVLLRFMAIRKAKEIGRSRNIAVTWCFLSLGAAVAIGLIGRAWAPALLTTGGNAETIFLHMAMSFFPPIIAGLVLSGILAASMSSSDSYLLIASSSIANDLAGHLSRVFTKKELAGCSVIVLTRVVMLIVAGFGVAIALSGNDSIFKIVSYAWAGFGASFGPLIIFSLFWKRTTLQGAIAGMVTGGAMVIIWKEVISKRGGAFAVYELLPAFILSCLVIWAVSLLTSAPDEEIEKEFDRVQKEVYTRG